MDGKKVQFNGPCGGQKGPSEIRSVPARGPHAGAREYELLVAEGHYRCPHCRRADLDEMNGAARRMR